MKCEKECICPSSAEVVSIKLTHKHAWSDKSYLLFICKELLNRKYVAAKRRRPTNQQLLVYWSSEKLQHHIAVVVMPRRSDKSNFSERLFFRDRILLPRRATKIHTDLILCDLLKRQNSVVETKIYIKNSNTDIKQFTATWCSDMSLSVYRPTSNKNWKMIKTSFLICLQNNDWKRAFPASRTRL